MVKYATSTSRRLVTLTGLCLLGQAVCAQSDHPLTLTECLQAAQSTSERTQLDAATLRKSQAAIDVARSHGNPSLRLFANARAASNTDVDPFGAFGDHARVGVSASYVLADGGYRSSQISAAQWALAATQAKVGSSHQQLELAVMDAFYGVVDAQYQQQTDQQRQQAAETNLNAAQERLKLGLVTRGDVETATSEVEAAKAAGATAQYQMLASQIALANLMGKDPATYRPTVAIPSPAEAQTLSDLMVEQAEKSSQDLKSADASIEEAKRQMESIRAGYRPRVSVGASAGVVNSNNPWTNDRNNTRGYASAGIELSMPLLQNSTRNAELAAQQAEIDLRIQNRDQIRRDLRARIASMLAEHQALVSRSAADTAAVTALEEAYRLASERYQVGKGSQPEVVQALSALSVARLNQAAAISRRSQLEQELTVWTQA